MTLTNGRSSSNCKALIIDLVVTEYIISKQTKVKNLIYRLISSSFEKIKCSRDKFDRGDGAIVTCMQKMGRTGSRSICIVKRNDGEGWLDDSRSTEWEHSQKRRFKNQIKFKTDISSR